MTYSTVKLSVGWKRHVLDRPRPALRDGFVEHRIEAPGRDDEVLAKRIVSLDESPTPRQERLELVHDRLEVGFRVRGRNGIVERPRLLIEAQLCTAEHAHTRTQRLELPADILMTQPSQLIAGRVQLCELAEQLFGIFVDRCQSRLSTLDVRLPFRRAIVRIHVVGVMLPERQHQLDVSFGHRVHSGCLATLCGGSHDQKPQRHHHDS